MEGQRWWMFCRAALLFRELKAFVASTRITASVSGAVNSWHIACTAASQPDGCPAHTWRGPAALWMSSLSAFAIAFPMMRLGVSPMPMGRTPGHLFRATRRHAINAVRPLGST